ncbi:peptidyl-prolyl cis-trans isomerase [Pseudacidobacterium ailaaui]|jgi:peptidyl-prolyl cis-trans isomerase SurA|uniref:peptidyl-prolyl cis-trans isomerase n=1 Tax=Pseudacidobacterium ailaaui TaxID=1382359 RepID=UPI000678F031|nr:peptidylprolyl isomerase [Pseudacidobacterium ailaaui]MDI3254834.1 peptidyl-prolyl cis-trans isomerase [Bacillota bacterium]
MMNFKTLPFPAAFLAGIAFLSGPSLVLAQSKPAAPAQDSPYQGTVVERIIARVNDQVITNSDYQRARQELEAQARQQGWSQQQLFEQEHNLLRDLIDQQLLLSKGKELGITGESETIKRLDDIRKQNHLDSMEDLQKAAESQGVSFEDFKQHIREGIISSLVIRDEVGRHLSVSQSEVQQYYDQHKADFDQPEQVRLSEILVPTPNPDDASQVEAAQKKADAIEAKLKSGADFAEVAKTESGGPTAQQGGDLGEFKRGQLAKVLEDQTFNLKAGEYTQPIRTKQGFVILKVTEHTPGGIQPLKEVEPQVEDALYQQKMAPALRQYLTRLREEAYIEIDSRDGYEDSAATPNETQPTTTYSAYVPPTGKKKKHVERTRFRQKGPRQKPETETASTPAPANAPSLAQVPGAAAAETNNPQTTAAAQPAPAQKNSQVASTGVEKPGKKEKIRFGQAPRETLPYSPTRTEDAGATTETASSNVPRNLQVVGPNGEVEDHTTQEKKEKSRFSDRTKLPKQKKSKDKTDPFAPAPETTDELATRQTQSTPLGLNGDTSKPKKEKPTGKTRLSDKAKEKPADQQQQQQEQTPSAPQPSTQSSQQK